MVAQLTFMMRALEAALAEIGATVELVGWSVAGAVSTSVYRVAWVARAEEVVVFRSATLGALEDVTLVLQMPGSDVNASFNDTTVGKDFDLVQFVTTATGANTFDHELWVSNAAGDYSHDDNLTGRDLIDASDASRRLCVSGTGALTCDAAALTAASVPFALSAVQARLSADPADGTRLDSLRYRSGHALDQDIDAPELDRWQLDRWQHDRRQ